jgi:hypothetical protein
MYLVFEILTISLGLASFLLMPDNPMSSRLTHDEKIIAIERLQGNQSGIENTTFKAEQMTEALKDFKSWMIVVIILAANVLTGISGTSSKGTCHCTNRFRWYLTITTSNILNQAHFMRDLGAGYHSISREPQVRVNREIGNPELWLIEASNQLVPLSSP